VKTLDYENYISNPEIRVEIERDARRARNEAIAPLANACGWLLKRTAQALLLIFTLANHRFYSPSWISGAEFNRSTQPRS
jgi:hypothetical protein